MLKFLERWLLLRLAIAMAGIVALAFIGMGSSVLIAEMLKGEAAAINQAGSLRMQSYLITTQLLTSRGRTHATTEAIREFDRRLRSRKITTVLPADDSRPLRAAYNHTMLRWFGVVRPLLVADARGPMFGSVRFREETLPQVTTFVSEVNQLVMRLQEDAESKIRLLRLIQAISLLLTIIVVYVTMYLMNRNILTPLTDLLSVAAHVRVGDFSARAVHTGEDELGRLGTAFNVMGEDLSKSYAELERRVAKKTIDLERSNRSLELLYHTSHRLNESPVQDAIYRLLLQDIDQTIGLGPGAICIEQGGENKALQLAATIDTTQSNLCNRSECRECMAEGRTHLRVFPESHAAAELKVLSVPLLDHERHYGALMLQVPAGADPEPWQVQLVEAIGQHIGIAIGGTLRATQSRRIALFEERSALARELHDSLAQSLSYLKIQISRLQLMLNAGRGGDTEAVLRELREGVTGAYRQLRELLTTFRLKMDGRGLGPALDETVAEFRSRGGIEIALVNHLQHCPLSVNEEIHVLQIVREALSNVVRHARAQHAHVSLECAASGGARVIIDDDGVGLGAMGARRQHYGLVIMQERAGRLGGMLRVFDRTEGGARVELSFVPSSRRPAPQGTPGVHVG